MIIECTSCHNRAPIGLGGPHGLHNVNSLDWQAQHQDFFETDRTRCQACHGLTLTGTVLAKAAATRNLLTQNDAPITIPKGTQVRCDMCHGNPL